MLPDTLPAPRGGSLPVTAASPRLPALSRPERVLWFWSRLPHALPCARQPRPAFKARREQRGRGSSGVTGRPRRHAFPLPGEAGGVARRPDAPRSCFAISSGVRGRVIGGGCRLWPRPAWSWVCGRRRGGPALPAGVPPPVPAGQRGGSAAAAVMAGCSFH